MLRFFSRIKKNNIPYSYFKSCGYISNKLFISVSILTSGYIFYNFKYTETSSVYLRFLRTFYIGILNSVDYKWSLYGHDEKSFEYNNIIKLCHQRSAERILNGCLQNGGLYIKLGQGLVALNHILPEQYISTLEKLHDKASPKSFEKVRQVFLEDLGKEPNEIFLEFNEKPFAAASLAQVHEAVSKSNKRLAVKVQYYDLRSRFNADIRTLEILLSLVESIHPKFGFSWVLKDMKATLAQELDFEIESENSKRCAKDLSHFKDVHIPKVHNEFCSKRILTTEFIDGIKINDVETLKKLKVNLKWLDRLLVQVFSHQLFHTGFVHADPHPGNVFVRVHGLKSPQLVILDHGLYEFMPKHERYHLTSLIKSLIIRQFKDTEYHSRQLGVQDWKTFGEIVLQRPLNLKDMNKQFKPFQSKLSVEEIQYMKQKSSEHFDKIMKVLREMPKPMLLFIRNLNTIRSICRMHGDPINRYVHMTDSAIRASYRDNDKLNFFNQKLSLQFELQMFKWKIRLSQLKEIFETFVLHLLNFFGYGLAIREIEKIYKENEIKI